VSQRSLLSLADYQRIYAVIYSVLEASEVTITHRACLLFACAGALILREHYNLPATISAGGAALMVDENSARVVVYGRDRAGQFVGERDAFHAWVQCDSWLIDFMAPIIGLALAEDGHACTVPRRMLQKPLAESTAALGDIQRLGEFCLSPNRELTESLIGELPVAATDLLGICNTWFRRPPRALAGIAMADSHGSTRQLVLKAPTIEGAW
jgi:hypothetical protein